MPIVESLNWSSHLAKEPLLVISPLNHGSPPVFVIQQEALIDVSFLHILFIKLANVPQLFFCTSHPDQILFRFWSDGPFFARSVFRSSLQKLDLVDSWPGNSKVVRCFKIFPARSVILSTVNCYFSSREMIYFSSSRTCRTRGMRYITFWPSCEHEKYTW